MPKRPVELPDNIPDCHAVIRRQADRIDELEARVAELLTRVDELVSEVSGLRRELHGSRRERFVPERAEDDPPPAEPHRPRQNLENRERRRVAAPARSIPRSRARRSTIPFAKTRCLTRFCITRERDASFDLSAKNWNCHSVVCA